MVDEAQNLSGGMAEGETRDVAVDMSQLALRVVSRALFGAQLDEEALDIGPEAKKQGASRLERGRNTFRQARELAEQRGWEFRWRLVEAEISPYAIGARIKLEGPELQLGPATAQTLALAVHELITNSAKYGALSAHAGRLSIEWEVQADILQFIWEERDGPEVEQPIARGFGTRSVIASVESQLGGRADFDWRTEGLIYRLSVPLGRELNGRGIDARAGFSIDDGEPMLRSAGAAE